MYVVKFMDKKHKEDSSYFYHNIEDAYSHIDLFRNDDSNLYSNVSIYDEATNLILDILLFDKNGNAYVEFKDQDLVKFRPEFCQPEELGDRFVITNIHEDTERCLIKQINSKIAFGYNTNVDLEMIEPIEE